MLTDDLSDYESSDEEIDRNLKEECEDEGSSDESNTNSLTKLSKRRRNGNKYRKTTSIKEQWKDFTAKESTENNL